jgi:hypothetical protein
MASLKRDVKATAGEGDGRRELVFRLGINEMIVLQDEWGIKDDQVFLEALDKPQSLKRFRSLVKQALVSHQPDITDEAAGALITELGMVRMKAILGETMAWAFPDPEPVKADTGKVEAASAGPLPS